MKSLDDVSAPQDGLRFFSWGERMTVDFEFRSEFGEPKFSNKGLLEAVVFVDGNEYILAPGSTRLLFALKPFAPLRGKRIRVTVVEARPGDKFSRQFRVEVAPSAPRPTQASMGSAGPRAWPKPGEQTLDRP